MFDYKKLLTNSSHLNNFYVFNPDLVNDIVKLQSPDVMTTLGKDKILEIYSNNSKTHSNIVASAIFLNNNIDESVIDEIINFNLTQQTLMFVLKRDNVNESTAKRVMEWLGKSYIKDRIDDFEFIMENPYSPFEYKDCPLSQKVVNMLEKDTEQWNYIYEKYINNNTKATEMIEKSISDEQCLMLAYNANLKDEIRNKAFDIAYNPRKMYKFATPHMVETMYLSAVDTLFNIIIDNKEEIDALEYSESIILGLIRAKKLPEDLIFDFVCRFENFKHSIGINIIEEIVQKSQNPDTLKKVIQLSNIMPHHFVSILQNAYKNPKIDGNMYENHISDEILRIIEMQKEGKPEYLIQGIINHISECINMRHCFIPHNLVKEINDDCFRYELLTHYDSVFPLKENICKTELDKTTALFFDEIMLNIKDEQQRNTIRTLFNQSLYETYTEKNTGKPITQLTQDDTSLNLSSWQYKVHSVTKQSGITYETTQKMMEIINKFKQKFPKPLLKNLRNHINKRSELTSHKYKINEILGINLIKTDSMNFNFYEIDLRELKNVKFSDIEKNIDEIKKIDINKKFLSTLTERILGNLTDMTKQGPEKILEFYTIIEKANLLYNTFKEMEEEKMVERTKIKERER